MKKVRLSLGRKTDYPYIDREEGEKDLLNKKHELEQLELFLFSIDDLLTDFIHQAGQQGHALDFSLKSLVALATYMRERKIENGDGKRDEFTACWVYLGEVFRQTTPGARWTVGLKHPRYVNYGLYFLTGFDEIESEFIPMLSVNNFTKNQSLPDDFFLKLIDYMLHPVPVNLDYLPTEG